MMWYKCREARQKAIFLLRSSKLCARGQIKVTLNAVSHLETDIHLDYEVSISSRISQNQAPCKYKLVSGLRFVSPCIIIHSNKSPTRCNNFLVHYPDVYLQLNMFRAFSRPSSGAQWLQWQLLVLPSYRGDSRAVRGRAGRPDHEHSTTITTIRT